MGFIGSESGWEAKTEAQLSLQIESKLRIQYRFLQDLMKGVQGKLRKIADEGYFHHSKILELIKTILASKTNPLKQLLLFTFLKKAT